MLCSENELSGDTLGSGLSGDALHSRETGEAETCLLYYVRADRFCVFSISLWYEAAPRCSLKIHVLLFHSVFGTFFPVHLILQTL